MTNNLVDIPGTEPSNTGIALNVANRLYLDRSDSKDLDDVTTGDWVRLAQGISDITPSSQEQSTKSAYYDSDGHDSTEVTGKSMQLAVKGNRFIGNPAQDYVYSKSYAFGEHVKTRVLWINNGDPVVSECTLTAIVATGGAANASQTFSFTIAFNGKPKTIKGELTMTEKSDEKGAYTAAVDTSVDGHNLLLGGHRTADEVTNTGEGDGSGLAEHTTTPSTAPDALGTHDIH